jgi:hypothetical protein
MEKVMAKCRCKVKPKMICSFPAEDVEIPGKKIETVGIIGITLMQCPDCKVVYAEVEE